MKLLLLLLLPSLLSADLVVSGGYMVVSSQEVTVIGKTEIQDATLVLESGSELITGDLLIQSNGILQGCGTVTVTGSVNNQGLILTDCGPGSTLILSGSVTNTASGVIRAENDTEIQLLGTVENNGVMDLIFSPSSAPAGITGSGTTVTSTTLPAISLDPASGVLMLSAFAGHSYQIQYTDDLTADPVVWTNHGSPVTVTSASDETVSIPVPASGIRVYRYSMQ